MLLIGAGLLAHSFVRLVRVDVGFDTGRVMRMQVNVGAVLDGSDEVQRVRLVFFEELRARDEAIPGVFSAQLTAGAPFSPGGCYSSIAVVGRPEGERGGDDTFTPLRSE